MSRVLNRPLQRTRDEIINALSTLTAPARESVLRVADAAIVELGSASHLEAAICVLATLAEKRELDRLDIMRDLRDRFELKRSQITTVGARRDDEAPSGFERYMVPADEPDAPPELLTRKAVRP